MERGKFKILVFVISSLCIAASFGQGGRQLENPALRNPVPTNPVGPGNVPVTTYQSGLVRSPSFDDTSEHVVTGRIGGGKHFRGVLPYNSMYDFSGTLPSSTFDSFQRYTEFSNDYYRNGVTPFYSYTSTVTRISPGTNTVIAPPSPKIRSTGSNTYIGLTPEAYQSSSPVGTRTGILGKTRFSPVGTLPPEQFISEQDGSSQPSLRRYEEQLEEFDRQLKQAKSKAEHLQKELKTETPTLDGLDEDTAQQGRNELLQAEEKDRQTDSPMSSDQTQPPSEQLDVYERMMQEYAQLNETYEQIFGETIESRHQSKKPSTWQGPDISERKLKYKQSTRITESPDASRQQQPERDKADQSTEQASAEARAVLSRHETFASYAQDKFNQSLRAAEQYMKQGKFYLAVDAYTLASMYKPDDPLVYAGRSHALFAAGEYVSSALYLAKAIEMFPAYVDFKIDIVSMIGDVDTVEKRITNINQWLEASKSPELHFLLAYIYMQLDRLPKADESIAQAYQKMPDVTAVAILREAIQKRLGK